MMSDSDIVISGISGRFPNADNVSELWNALLKGELLAINEAGRWPIGLFGLNAKMGIIRNIDKIDADFFGLTETINCLDPQDRIAYEVIYEAIWDAGTDPESLRGTRTALISGQFTDDTRSSFSAFNHVGIPTQSIGTIASKFGFLGPVFKIDTACSSSASALNEGLIFMKKRICDSLIVMGTNIVLNPIAAAGYKALGTTSREGVCRCLDAGANGHTRSEAIAAIVIQKASNAKRVYASILSCASNNDGYKEEGNLFPKTVTQSVAMKNAIKKAEINPLDVEYVEAHITGTVAGDPVECESILSAFRGNEQKPLLVGCLKSNTGHTESSAGICAIVKSALIFQNEIIPRNINFKTANPNIEGLRIGRLLPVLTNTPLKGEVIAVNSMGIGGSNVSVILKRSGNNSEKSAFKIADKIPRLINICGRTEEGVIETMRWIERNRSKVTFDFISLLNDVSKIHPESGMTSRGFVVVDEEVKILYKNVSTASTQLPLYFVFTGFSEKFSVFDTRHMNIEPFAESIKKSVDVAMKYGFDLRRVFENREKVIEHSKEFTLAFVAIQIAYYETLKSLELIPTACIGHSTGEIVCSFIQDNMTLEMLFEQILTRGQYIQISPMTTYEDSFADISEESCIIEIGRRRVGERLKPNCIAINFNVENNIVDTLVSIGEIYSCGHNPGIEKLYPKVQYPVSRQTASLSPLLKWNHKKDFYVAQYPRHFNHSIEIEDTINLSTDEYRFLCDHAIDGRILFPATGYIYFALQHFLLLHGLGKTFHGGVLFTDLKFRKAIKANKGDTIKFKIRMNSKSGQFLITSQEVKCVTGRIQFSEQFIVLPSFHENFTALNEDAIYKEFRVRGYDYGSNFQALVEADFEGRKGKVESPSHLITYLDTIMHLLILNSPTRDLYLPTRIGSLFIDLNTIFKNISNKNIVDVFYESESKTLISDGYLAKNISFVYSPRRRDTERHLQYYSFVPLNNHFNHSSDMLQLLSKYTELCVTLVQSMRNNNHFLSEALVKDISAFEVNLFPFLNDLVECFKKKWTLNEFIEFAMKSNYTGFPLNTKKSEMIEEQLQSYLCWRFSTKIAVIEVNDTGNTSETTVKNSSRVYNCSCDYKVVNKSEFLSTSNTGYDIFIYEDRSSKLLFGCESFTSKDTFKKIVDKAYNDLSEKGIFLCNFRSKLTNIEKEIMGLSDEDEANLVLNLERILSESRFAINSKKTDDSFYTSVQLQKIEKTSNMERVVINLNAYNFEWLNEVKAALIDPKKQIWLKSNIRDISGVVGLTKSLLHEYDSQKIKCIVGDESEITDEINSKGLSVNIIKNGVHGTMMLKPLRNTCVSTKHAYVDLPIKGDLSKFQWIESALKLCESHYASEGRLMAKVYYSSLNFKDLLIATNRISADVMSNNSSSLNLGFEFSGVDTKGRRIFGMSLEPCIATTVALRNDDSIFEVPAKWTLAEASTVATTYMTAYYGLIMRAKLKPNESVLIHSGSGAVGQAAIRLCMSMNCEVFTSVGNEERKQKLKKLFPRLKEENIVDSRSVSFEEKILKATNGMGVDVVLNSLSEEKLTASINCLAENGRFVEIGKYDIGEDNPFERSQKNITLEVVCLRTLQESAILQNNETAKKQFKELCKLVNEGIENDIIQPLPVTVFENNEIENAFRFMAAAKHFGKVVIKMREENKIDNELKVEAKPRSYFYPQKVYLLIGGLGGMGLQLAYWMVQRGAQKLVLTTRRGISDVYQKYIIELMQKEGCRVVIESNSGCDYDSVLQLIKTCNTYGEIGGIFNTALILESKLFEETTPEMMNKISSPKVQLTDFLDQISRKLCPHIDYFVCFSSAITWLGNEGQSSYGFANSAMETICKRRKRDGLHALAIQWGAIGDVGYFHEVSALKSNDMKVLGMKQQRIYSCLEVLDILLAADHPICSCISYSALDSIVFEGNTAVDRVLHILGILSGSNVDERKTLVELGADSLLVVEIQHLMEKYFNVCLTNKQIRTLTLAEIRDF